jgi:hypothetical protein
MFMGGGPISWKSSKQTSVALSSTEAAYMGQASAATNLAWARGISKEMNIEDTVPNHQRNEGTVHENQKMDGKKKRAIIPKKMENPTIIQADNQGAIKLAVNNLLFQKRTKQIAIKYHYTRDLMD